MAFYTCFGSFCFQSHFMQLFSVKNLVGTTLSEQKGSFNDDHGDSELLINSYAGVVALKWKNLNAKELNITSSNQQKLLSRSLQEKIRCEVYYVGRCAGDLILKQIPKDFDTITSAELRQVVKAFSRCDIVGRRFPIWHVHVDDTFVEVNVDLYANVVYDYIGGMEDLKQAKVRTLILAHTSFQEDCGRILRAIGIAARLGFRLTKETAFSVKDLCCSILRLHKVFITLIIVIHTIHIFSCNNSTHAYHLMEMNIMLAYGSAGASLRLLWKVGLLDDDTTACSSSVFCSLGFRRRDKRLNMLFSLFANLDSFLAPNRPCHQSLWIAMLVFHKALTDDPKGSSGSCHICTRSMTLKMEDLASLVKIALRRMNHFSQAMASSLKAPYSDSNLLEGVEYVFVRVVFDTIYPAFLNQRSKTRSAT
ncbi:hypothetical protein MKX01_008156 [Papaver californicum]|nr:hypothetical protein MKX01_008156 [Papaver californicum]